ncbi:hypothetical protein ACTFIU_008858 [Dictyostelium citrinum]
MKYFIVLFLSFLFNYCNSQVSSGELYSDSNNEFFTHLIHYYPASTFSNYTGEHFVSFESSVAKFVQQSFNQTMLVRGNVLTMVPANFIRVEQQSPTPRSYIRAIRSFGSIIGDSFILAESKIEGTVYSMGYHYYIAFNNSILVTNSIWNKVLFKDNGFFGDSEVRPTYPMSIQPTIKISFLRVDSDLSTSSSLFSLTFKCNYISIINSNYKANLYDGDDGANFFKRYTEQVYFSNVNGSKDTHSLLKINQFAPFFQI